MRRGAVRRWEDATAAPPARRVPPPRWRHAKRGGGGWVGEGLTVPKILTAQALSSIGTSVSTVALAVMMFELTGSVLHMGGVLAASALPIMVMSVLGGVLLDRYDGRILMILSDCLRGLLILLMPLLAGWSIAWVYVVAAGIGALSAVFNPSQVEVLAEHTLPEQRVRTNSWLAIARDGAELGGYLVGGALVAGLGYATTFSLDAGTYALSALILLTLPRTTSRRRAEAASVGRLLGEVPGIFRQLWGTPTLRVNLLVALLPMAALMMSTPNAYALALEVYDKGPQGLAWMEAITAGGMIVGGLLAGRRNYRGDLNLYVLESVLLMGAASLLVGLMPGFWAAVAFLAVGAVGNVAMVVGSISLYQNIDARPERGRIIALRTGAGQLGAMVGLLAGGVLGAVLGVKPAFIVMGLAGMILVLLVYVPYLLGRSGGAAPDRSETPPTGAVPVTTSDG